MQQLVDFKNGLRASADPRKTNTTQMIQAAKAMTDEEMKEPRRIYRIDEVDAVDPRWSRSTRAEDAHRRERFFAMPDGGTEPLGSRIVETPEDGERFELRDPHSGFVAYVPPGSMHERRRARGERRQARRCRATSATDWI